MKNEIWLPIKEYPKYEVSDKGKVRNKYTKRILKQSVQNSGYSVVCLSNKGIRKTYSVHRLVMEAFKPNKNSHNLDVNHIDYNKMNNELSNLEWVSRRENVLHGSGPNELKILESMLCNRIRIALHQWYDQLLNVRITKECWTEKVVEQAIAGASELYLHKNIR